MSRVRSFSRSTHFLSEVCARQVNIFEPSDLVWLCQFHADPVSICLISCSHPKLGKGELCRVCFISELLALHSREIETLQHIALIYVPFQKLLVIGLVLVGHACLAGHLCVPVEFLWHRCVVLSTMLCHARQALDWIDCHRKGLIRPQSRVQHQWLPLTEALHTCNVLNEARWNLANSVYMHFIMAFVFD